MSRELGAIVRNQIPAGRKSVLDAYGDILYRAWRDATGACLLEVEDLAQVWPTALQSCFKRASIYGRGCMTLIGEWSCPDSKLHACTVSLSGSNGTH